MKDIKNLRDTQCSYNRGVNIVEMSFLLKLIYRFSVILINTLIDFYVEFNKINILEVYRGQRSKNNQQTIKKKNRDLIK